MRLLTALLIVLTSLVVPASASADLAARWSLDDLIGGVAPDFSGGGQSASPQFGASLVSGGARFSGALQTSPGTDPRSGLTVAPSARLRPARVTVVAWVRAAASPGPLKTVVAQGARGCVIGSYWLGNDTSGRLTFGVGSGVTMTRSPAAPLSLWDNAWHAVAGTFDGSTARLYVDGVQVGAGTAAPAIEYGLTDDSLTIGTFPGALGCEANPAWPGLIDEVRIYDSALRGSEVAWLHGSTTDPPRDLPAPAPTARTTGADQVTLSSARVTGTIDPAGLPRDWYVEFGPTTAYGSRSATQTLAGGAAQTVTAELGGLNAATTYHARLVADGVAGEDVTFTTLAPETNAPGLPPSVDFGWDPRREPLVAGETVRFAATDGPGVAYAWDFDYRAADGFRPAAGGRTPEHVFTADGAHDTNRADGATGERRRTYAVRVRATAADGTQTEVEHQVVVMPNEAPLADFAVKRTSTSVNSPVTFVAQARDPDDGLARLEWDLDTDGAADIVCDGAGTNCAGPGGAPLGPWFSAGAGGAITVNFFQRGLAAHGLLPLALINLDQLPATQGGIAVSAAGGGTVFSPRDPRLAYLYDNATLLQQSSFNTDAGEATGAKLAAGSLRVRRDPSAKLNSAAVRRQAKLLLESKRLAWRRVTLTAVDTTGRREAISQALPLVPDAAPKLQAQFVNRDPNARTPSVFLPGRTKLRQAEVQKLGYTLTTADEIAFDAGSTTDPDGKVAYYTLEVGAPFGEAKSLCIPKVPGAVPTGFSPIPTPGEVRPGEAFPGGPAIGTGPTLPSGRLGNLPVKGPNPRTPGAAFRVAGAPLQPLATLLGSSPLRHSCFEYTKRNVDPGTFMVRPAQISRPAIRSVSGDLLTPQKAGLEFPTSAIVTRNPGDLRFRIPNPGTYSVAIGAYDEAGLGAIQRTDGLQVFAAQGTCQNIGGEPLKVGGRTFGFSGQCVSFAASRTRFWSDRAVSVNGVGLRAVGGGIYIDTAGHLIATTARPANLASASVSAMNARPADVEILMSGQPVARLSDLTSDRARDFLLNRIDPTVPAGAKFFGSPIARPATPGPDPDAFDVLFADDTGRSVVRFNTVLPTEFSRENGDTSPTSEVILRNRDTPRSTELETNRYAEIASAKKRAKARAAADEPSTLDLSGTTLGPVSIDEGKLTFDPDRGYFSGDLKVSLTVASPIEGIDMHLVIADGGLKEARGAARFTVPIFAGVTLDELRFTIISDPLTIGGGASASVVKVLRGDLDLMIRTDPVLFRLTGKISLLSLPLGGAYVQYDAASAKTLTFGGNLGVDFGPVSVQASLDGGISFETGDFFVQGRGDACLFICLGVDALISNKALAACGSVDLLFGEIAAGFAYVFGDGLEVFWGCDLQPYRPAVFRVRGGVTADAAQAPAGPMKVPRGAEQAAFRFRGQPGLAGAPKLTLTAPDGRTFSTGGVPGDYAFAPPGAGALASDNAGRATPTPGALVDEDPITKTTTILVVNPPAGEWRVALAPGQPPLAKADFALGASLDDRDLRANVSDADLVGRDRVRIGSTVVRTDDADLRAEPAIERPRQRGAIIKVPKGLTGTMVLADITPASTTVVRKVDLERYAGRRLPVVFTPTADPGTHELRALVLHEDGTPRRSVRVDTFASPPVPQPSAPDLDVDYDDGRVTLDVKPGSAGPLSDPATSFEIVAQTSSGRRVERHVDRDTSRRLPNGAFRITLGSFSRDEYRALRVSGRMLYAGRDGRVTSVRTAR